MKAKILNLEGKETKEIALAGIFSSEIRKDIVSKILEAKKSFQPFGPSLVAGKQHSASGRISHRRKVWRSGYGRGMARVPRKIFTRRGSQFIWAGAEVASARGGRRAHPPKPISMINTGKINKKEFRMAFASAISATANKKEVSKKYKKLEEKDIRPLPIVVEGKIISQKTKNLSESLKKILGKKVYDISVKKKSIRSGKGKLRGRRYKENAGLLIVTGKDEKVKTKVFDVANASNLNVTDLASGGQGRLTVYTENAIKELGERLK